MTEKKPNVITVNDKEYELESLTDRQKALLAHIQDLDRKINNTKFNMDQLMVGREAFANQLAIDLETPATDEAA